MASRPTIKDVAALAGVSLKTVSRVLNEEPGVRPDKTSAVREAVMALKFQRNEAAANLRRIDRSTHIIGLVIEDVANPFYSVVAGAVEAVAREHGHLVLVASSGEDPTRERELVDAFCARRVDGLVIVPTGDEHAYLLDAVAAGTPVVFVDRPGLPGQMDSVVTDNVEGARNGVSHLLARGHRRIAFVGDEAGMFTAEERFRGYCEAIAAAGVSLDHTLVRFGSHDVEAAEAAVADLLGNADPPTAIFAGNNRLTMGTIRAVGRRGLPVAVVGFDDFELAEFLDPPVTVVAHDVEALGRAAAELLYSRLGGDERPFGTVTIGTSLITRGSGEIPPGTSDGRRADPGGAQRP